MKVSEIMQKKFLCLDADTTLQDAAKRMADRGLDEAPVVVNGQFIGTLSSSDIAAVLVKTNLVGKATSMDAGRISRDPVYKHIAHRPIYLDENADLLSAIAFIIHCNDDTIPILDGKKKLVGVVFTSRVQKEMAKLLATGALVPQAKAKLAEAGKTQLPSSAREAQKAPEKKPAGAPAAKGGWLKFGFGKPHEAAKAPSQLSGAPEAIKAPQKNPAASPAAPHGSWLKFSFGKPAAKAAAQKIAPAITTPQALPSGVSKEGTEIDSILLFIQKRGTVSAEEAAKEFGIAVPELEEYAISMEKHGLLKLEYSLFGKMKITSMVGKEAKQE